MNNGNTNHQPQETAMTDSNTQAWLAEQNAKQPIREAYFNLVADKANWKNPINAFVPATIDLDAITDAVIHFTGSVPTYTMTRKGWNVKAAGYYVAIGA